MKVKTVPILAAFAMAFMALQAPTVFAQRARSTFVGTPQPQGLPASQQPINVIPSTVILPMSNPIAPMGNPVAPAVPFIRYGGSTSTVVVPESPRGGNRGNNGRGRDVIYVPVPVPTSYYPSNYYYPELQVETVTVPGQLPSRRYDYPSQYQGDVQNQGQVNFNSNPNAPASAQPSSTFVGQAQAEVYSEPRMIVNEPRPNRVVVPPAIGTSRADVIAVLGQPWGTIQTRGQETLYFDGVTVVFSADGRVIQAR